MYFIGQLVGAIIPVFILSRIFLWLSRKWYNGLTAIGMGYLLTVVVTIALAEYGFANGGAPRFFDAVIRYGPAIIVCFAVDFNKYLKQIKSNTSKNT